MNINVIGLDIAKNVFHLIGLNQAGKVQLKKKLKRAQMLNWFAQQAVCTICMEACGSAHYWARELEKLGFEVKLLPAQHVKAFVQGSKNDYNDALAIAEASQRPKLHKVRIKTLDQQDKQALQRMRTGSINDRTALCNQVRGLLAEYGLVIPRGVSQLRKALPTLLEDADNGLTDFFRELLARKWQQLRELDEHIQAYNQKLQEASQHCEPIQRLQSIPGFGPVTANSFYCEITDGQAFRCGRDVSAYLGLVPRQHTSGDKTVLLGITKRGNKHLRSLLIHGARAALSQAAGKEDALSRWAIKLAERRGFNKAVVALANKLARIGWAVLARGETYEARMA